MFRQQAIVSGALAEDDWHTAASPRNGTSTANANNCTRSRRILLTIFRVYTPPPQKSVLVQ